MRVVGPRSCGAVRVRKSYLFASASRLPLLGLGDRPPVEEVTHTRAGGVAVGDRPPVEEVTHTRAGGVAVGEPLGRPMTRREQMDELVRISNRQTVLHHLHPRRERQAYEDAQ